MMPILFEWNSLIVPAWHFFFLLAALGAYALLLTIRRLFLPSISEKDVHRLFLVGYISGYFGARAFSLINDENVRTVGAFVQGILSLGAMTFYGGLMATIICCYLFVLVRQLNALDCVDLCFPPAFLGLAIGRIGCFLNGDDFGIPVPQSSVGAWWAVTFPNLEDGLARYPVQLWETFFASLLVILTVLYFERIRQKIGAGSVGLGLLGCYSVFRFFAEYYRGDDRGWLVEGLISPAQGISVILFLGSLILGVLVYRKRLFSLTS